jgi:glycosyltransferase involved in cell wall biosynthesis
MLTFVASSLWHLPRLAARLRPDLVFAFFGIPCGPAALRVRRCLGIPYALSLRGSDVPRPELGHQRLLEAVTRPVLRRVWRSADALIAVGGDLRAAVLAVEPTLDVKVIPNGVDAERFRPPSAKTRTPGALRLLFVGRLREFKGLQFCIEALAQRPASAPRVSLDIVGEGPYRGRLEDMVERHGLAGQVRFLGWLEPARVPDYYASADALALPSYAEGSPNVILEAMAAGLAVLTSDAPGCREMVEHGKEGLLLPVGDVGAWRAAIDRLASTPELVRAMGATGMAKARAFSWTEVARRHLEIFERIV